MINLRSDTATKPSSAMTAFALAHGDGNMGHDGCPSIHDLEEEAASIFGAESALFTFGGTKSNMIALRVHAPLGSKVFTAAGSHIDRFAEGVFAREPIKLQAIPTSDGFITAEELQDVLDAQMDRSYTAPASTIVLENTMGYKGGAVYPYQDFKQVAELAHSNGMKVHVDGARILHAAVAEGRAPWAYMQHADTMSMCLAKALGAPQGSLLLGDRDSIGRAKEAQRQMGDNLYNLGWLGAAGLYALQNHIKDIKVDHELAAYFQETIKEYSDGIEFMHDTPPTNMVLFNVSGLGGLRGTKKSEEFVELLEQHMGVRLYAMPKGWVRAIPHRNVSESDIHEAADATVRMVAALG